MLFVSSGAPLTSSMLPSWIHIFNAVYLQHRVDQVKVISKNIMLIEMKIMIYLYIILYNVNIIVFTEMIYINC
jgi:hypothetical protein